MSKPSSSDNKKAVKRSPEEEEEAVEEVPVQEQKDDEKNMALEKVKRGLYSVKVSRHDATATQRELERELFKKWHEKCEVMEAKRIDKKNINEFLDYMESAYEGIDEETRKKMNGIKWAEEWDHKVIEFKYAKGDSSSGARYGMIAFGKSSDGNFIDCMYCLYKIDFEIAPVEIVTNKEHSVLWGLVKWTTTDKEIQERTLGIKSLKNIKNFFRYKALEGFYNEGLIDQMNIVPSIEQVTDLK